MPEFCKVILQVENGAQTFTGTFEAVSLPCWLRVEPASVLTRHKWILLRYSSGFFDEPDRPLIRFITSDNKIFIQPMNGTLLGSAEWIGRVPDDTVSVSISPTKHLGRFSFRIDLIEPVSLLNLLRRGLATDFGWMFWALRSKLLNSKQEAWQALKYAIGGTPLSCYDQWHARLARPLDLNSFDQPKNSNNSTAHFHLLMFLDGNSRGLQHTLQSLQAQTYPKWTLHAEVTADAEPTELLTFLLAAQSDERIRECNQIDLGAPRPSEDERLAILHVGDELSEYALSAMAQQIAEKPYLVLQYSDEDAIDDNGLLHSPVLKPDWSPTFYEAIPYLGRLTCISRLAMQREDITGAEFLRAEVEAIDRLLAHTDPAYIGHVRRILYRRRSSSANLAQRPRPKNIQIHQLEDWPEVSIVIPTRNHSRLLKDCIRGIVERTDYPNLNVVVVDNGSTEDTSLEYLAKLEGDARFRILTRPGPFNYSSLCNDGAKCTEAPILAFLNNDIVIRESGWLKEMVRLARQPRVGVVGAKLLFPDERIQHAGVVLGMGGIAGHIYRRSQISEAGYMHQLEVTRESFAVTAACIVLQRTKFEAVGGFDAENLPVDLNDIDLCLRISKQGWFNLWTPKAVLTHVQSATRGNERDPFELYRQERTYFSRRWMEDVRNDPFFHSGLSLFSHWPHLG